MYKVYIEAAGLNRRRFYARLPSYSRERVIKTSHKSLIICTLTTSSAQISNSPAKKNGKKVVTNAGNRVKLSKPVN
jgi:hypothetical protein